MYIARQAHTSISHDIGKQSIGVRVCVCKEGIKSLT
jgi:hypothetical protein